MAQSSQNHIIQVRILFTFHYDCSSCGRAGVQVKSNIFEGISRYCSICEELWHPAFSDEEKFRRWNGEMLRTLQKRLDEEGPHSFHWGFGDFE